MNWDDLRTVLAVSRAETLLGAAKRLGVNQTTVSRRVKAAEAALGARLFARVRGRHVATGLGVEVTTHAERIEAEVLALAARADKEGATLTGTVRLTAVTSILQGVLMPGLGELAHRHPDIHLDLIGADANLSFSRRETDLALRLGRPRSGQIVMRKLGDVPYGLYAPVGGTQDVPAQGGCWVAYDDSLDGLPEQRWLEHHRGTGVVVFRANGVRLLADAIAAGVGLGMLPRPIGDAHGGLMRVGAPEPLLYRELWLLIHEEIAAWPRIRAVVDWLVERAKATLDP